MRIYFYKKYKGRDLKKLHVRPMSIVIKNVIKNCECKIIKFAKKIETITNQKISVKILGGEH